MSNIIICLERIFNTQLHGHLPHSIAALVFLVDWFGLSNRHHLMGIVKLESIIIKESNEQFSHTHGVLVGKAVKKLEVTGLVEVGVVGSSIVGVDIDLGEWHAGKSHSSIPVGRELLHGMIFVIIIAMN